MRPTSTHDFGPCVRLAQGQGILYPARKQKAKAKGLQGSSPPKSAEGEANFFITAPTEHDGDGDVTEVKKAREKKKDQEERQAARKTKDHVPGTRPTKKLRSEAEPAGSGKGRVVVSGELSDDSSPPGTNLDPSPRWSRHQQRDPKKKQRDSRGNKKNSEEKENFSLSLESRQALSSEEVASQTGKSTLALKGDWTRSTDGRMPSGRKQSVASWECGEHGLPDRLSLASWHYGVTTRLVYANSALEQEAQAVPISAEKSARVDALPMELL
eukprot:5619099-Amphidinium_carterae.1